MRLQVDAFLLLIPLSVVLVGLIAAAFAWSVSNGQFDDLDAPAHRVLADDDSPGTDAPAEGPAKDRRP